MSAGWNCELCGEWNILRPGGSRRVKRVCNNCRNRRVDVHRSHALSGRYGTSRGCAPDGPLNDGWDDVVRAYEDAFDG